MKSVWRLRSHLLALLLVNMGVVFVLVGTAAMLWRVPEIERESRQELGREIEDVTARLELLLGAGQSRLELVASLLRGQAAQQAGDTLAMGVSGSLLFQAMYLVAPGGKVEAAALGAALRGRDEELVGSDLSSNALYQAVQGERTQAWSGKYLSALSGAVSVGLALRKDSGRVLVGEIALASLLRALRAAGGQEATALWVVDRGGEVIADTEGGRHVGRLNIRNWPLLQGAADGRAAPGPVYFEQERFHAVVSHSAALDWYVVGRTRAGWDSPDVRRVVLYVAGMVLACLVLGALVASVWASRMARPLQDIVARAALATGGRPCGERWPRGFVAEFNALSGDLQAMASSLQEREQRFLAIFNASPVPMTVVDADHGHRLLDVNEAWCREFRRGREQVLGRTALEIGLLQPAQRAHLQAQFQAGNTSVEATLTRGDGELVPGKVFMRTVPLPSGRLAIWATIDIGPLRRAEQALHELNQQLELRVAQRTEALAAANATLSDTAAQLRDTRHELVRAEKMGALGKLVAGVAHELHTPLGNGVMAVSAMGDGMRRFQSAMQGGLKRADLQQMVDSVEQGTDIAGRNLRRAAELVQSFKQVAVDQTTSQRRRFELAEVVHEMVVSLRPSFVSTPYRIEVDVPAIGLALDSYPGALGQAIGNLVHNAVLHGFDGRAHGTVRLSAERAEDGRIVLRVADDGRGIAPALLADIFEPFVTSSWGHEGPGLGLHISHTAVVDLLGGTLTARSVPGAGACFEMRLPARAPHAAGEGQGEDTGEKTGAGARPEDMA